MSFQFRPPSSESNARDNFSAQEVGLTHPSVKSFIKLRDNGDVEICAGEDVAIVLSPRSGSITLFADHIKMITSHDQGVRINDLALNEAATHFDQPTFVELDASRDVYEGVDYYLEDEDEEVDVNSVASDVLRLIRQSIDVKGV